MDSSGETHEAVILTDTDLLLRQDIEDNRAATLARTALRVAMRTLATHRAKREFTSVPIANLVVNLGADLFADQLEKADTRLCFLLPRTVQVARIGVSSGNHWVQATAVDSLGKPVGSKAWQSIYVGPGEKKFIFFPSLI